MPNLMRTGCLSLCLLLLALGSAKGGFVDRGDANNDGVVDLSDVIRLLEFLSRSSDVTICLSATDANMDGQVDYSDAIYMLRYMFLSGDAPVPYNPGGDIGCYSYVGNFDLKNEAVSVLSPVSALVGWETPFKSDTRVLYGRDASLKDGEVRVDERVMYHQALLTGLEPNTTYFYLASSDTGDGSSVTSTVQTFATLPDITIGDVAGHPRLFVNAAELPKIRQRVSDEGGQRALWNVLTSWCRSILETPAEEISAGDHFLEHTRALAFVGLVEGNKLYRSKAIELVSYRIENGSGGEARETAEAMAFVYDWLYDNLSGSQKSMLAKALYKSCTTLNGAVLDTEFISGLSHGTNKACFLAALALYGDEPGVKGILEERLRDYNYGFLASWRRYGAFDGGTNKGWWYTTYGLPFEMEFLTAWRSATGQDLFPQERVWCERMLDLFLFGLRADLSLLREGDMWLREGLESQNRHYGLLMAREYGNPQGKWFAGQAERASGIWAPHAIFDILWWEPKIEPLPPVGVTSRWFRNAGVLVCRESWGEDAALASFRSSETYTLGHQHRDDCSFTLYYKGDLAMESGIYDEYASDHYNNYYCRTIAHNALTVFDPDEKFIRWGDAYANDGGQRWLVPGEDPVEIPTPSTPEETVDRAKGFRSGGIIRYEDDKTYVYAVGNGGPSYAKSKVTKFYRHFLWLREGQGWSHPVLVIFDDVVATRDSFRKAYLLHTKNKPEVDGPLVTARTDDSVLYQWTVAPPEADVAVIGGRGSEFWVNGKNYPPNRKPYGKEDPGAWRVEVSPLAKQKAQTLLHVLYAGDKLAEPPAKPQGFTVGTLQGVVVGEWVILFDFGKPLFRVEYESPIQNSCHLVAGAVPTAEYDVYFNGVLKNTVRASFAGLLRFDLGSTGRVRIQAKI